MKPPPIFIAGAPRSGTTLLRQMLNRHPKLGICGETHFLEVVYQDRRRRAFGDLAHAQNRQRLIQAYLSMRRVQRHLEMDLGKVAEWLEHEGVSYPAMFAAILSCYAESHGKLRGGEKTPQHALFTERFFEWFPDAAVLHIIRDPRDVVASLLHRPSASASVVANARAWLKLNLAARRCSHRAGYLEVRYETLIPRPEEELRRICQFIGEEYSPSMLTPEQQQVEDDAGMDRYRTPLTPSRLGLWRQELTAREVAQVEWVLGDQMEAFGYSREVPPASVTTILRGAGFAAFDLVRIAFQRLPAVWHYYSAPTDLLNYDRWRYPPDTGERVRTSNAAKSLRA